LWSVVCKKVGANRVAQTRRARWAEPSLWEALGVPHTFKRSVGWSAETSPFSYAFSSVLCAGLTGSTLSPRRSPSGSGTVQCVTSCEASLHVNLEGCLSLAELAEAIRLGLFWIEDLAEEGAEDRLVAELRDLLQRVLSEYLKRVERSDQGLMHLPP
jgi:hypothetical protein